MIYKFKFRTLNKLILIFILFISISSFGQGKLEDAFDDPKGETNFNVGLDFLRIASGTPSLQLGANFANKKILLRGEIGATIMGYKLQMQHKIIDPKVKPGITIGFNVCHKVFELNNQNEGKFYLGGDIQYWNYSASNTSVLNPSGYNQYKLNLIEFNTEESFSFNYSFRAIRIGLMYGYVMPINKKIDFQTFICFGKAINSVKYDESSSFGIQWIDNPPSGWEKLNRVFYSPFYGRFTLGITYNFL
jgi:hypothetical protein